MYKPDWDSLLEFALVDKEELRKEVDLVKVLQLYGIGTIPYGTRQIGHCPFHDDEDPSFAVWWHHGTQYCGCWSCSFGPVDVFDFVGVVEKINTFPKKMKKVIELKDEIPNMKPPEPPEKEEYDLTFLADQLEFIGPKGPDLAVEFFEQQKDLSVWAGRKFRVGETPTGSLAFPHFSPNGEECTAIKYRRPPEWRHNCVTGSSFKHLYGIWNKSDWPDAVLCEGETDTISAKWWVPHLDVFGLPSGVQQTPKDHWLEFLESKNRVYLALDGDEAGREATKKWSELLTNSVPLWLPDGEDINSLGKKKFKRLLLNTEEQECQIGGSEQGAGT